MTDRLSLLSHGYSKGGARARALFDDLLSIRIRARGPGALYVPVEFREYGTLRLGWDEAVRRQSVVISSRLARALYMYKSMTFTPDGILRTATFFKIWLVKVLARSRYSKKMSPS